MFAQIVGAAKGDDFRIFRRCHGQPRAGRDGEAGRIGEGVEIGGRYCLRLARSGRIDQECGKDAGDPRQFERCNGRILPGQRQGAERPLHGGREVERRIGHGQGGGQIERLHPRHQHRCMGRGGGPLVAKLQRRRAGGGDQHVMRRRIGSDCGFHRQQDAQFGLFAILCRALHRDRPAMPQGIHRQRHPARRGGRGAELWPVQRSNSVTSGTWSDGFSQSRACSWTLCPTACFASSGLAHM